MLLTAILAHAGRERACSESARGKLQGASRMAVCEEGGGSYLACPQHRSRKTGPLYMHVKYRDPCVLTVLTNLLSCLGVSTALANLLSCLSSSWRNAVARFQYVEKPCIIRLCYCARFSNREGRSGVYHVSAIRLHGQPYARRVQRRYLAWFSIKLVFISPCLCSRDRSR